jgi:hypothetical protein
MLGYRRPVPHSSSPLDPFPFGASCNRYVQVAGSGCGRETCTVAPRIEGDPHKLLQLGRGARPQDCPPSEKVEPRDAPKLAARNSRPYHQRSQWTQARQRRTRRVVPGFCSEVRKAKDRRVIFQRSWLEGSVRFELLLSIVERTLLDTPSAAIPIQRRANTLRCVRLSWREWRDYHLSRQFLLALAAVLTGSSRAALFFALRKLGVFGLLRTIRLAGRCGGSASNRPRPGCRETCVRR